MGEKSSGAVGSGGGGAVVAGEPDETAMDPLPELEEKNGGDEKGRYSIDVKGPSSEAKATRLRAAVRRRREFTKPTLPVYKTGPQLSLELMDEMMTRGLSPNGFTYGAVINAAAAEGHWERALGLLGTARASGMPLGQSE